MASIARPHRLRFRNARSTTRTAFAGAKPDANDPGPDGRDDDEGHEDGLYADGVLAGLFPPEPHDPFDSTHTKRVAYQAVLDLLHGFATTVSIARCLAGSERQVDLTGLNEAAGRLCARALDLRPEHGRQLITRLRSVLAELDALHTILVPDQQRAHAPD
jgi:hypothetical protein